MGSVVKGLDKVMASMDLEKVWTTPLAPMYDLNENLSSLPSCITVICNLKKWNTTIVLLCRYQPPWTSLKLQLLTLTLIQRLVISHDCNVINGYEVINCFLV